MMWKNEMKIIYNYSHIYVTCKSICKSQTLTTVEHIRWSGQYEITKETPITNADWYRNAVSVTNTPNVIDVANMIFQNGEKLI